MYISGGALLLIIFFIFLALRDIEKAVEYRELKPSYDFERELLRDKCNREREVNNNINKLRREGKNFHPSLGWIDEEI